MSATSAHGSFPLLKSRSIKPDSLLSKHSGFAGVAVAIDGGQGDGLSPWYRDALAANTIDTQQIPSALVFSLDCNSQVRGGSAPFDTSLLAVLLDPDLGGWRFVMAEPLHGRYQCWLGVNFLEAGADTALILDQAACAPVDMTVPIATNLAGKFDLARYFADLAPILWAVDALGGDAGPYRALALVSPPLEQFGKTLLGWVDTPVELGREVVDP